MSQQPLDKARAVRLVLHLFLYQLIANIVIWFFALITFFIIFATTISVDRLIMKEGIMIMAFIMLGGAVLVGAAILFVGRAMGKRFLREYKTADELRRHARNAFIGLNIIPGLVFPLISFLLNTSGSSSLLQVVVSVGLMLTVALPLFLRGVSMGIVAVGEGTKGKSV